MVLHDTRFYSMQFNSIIVKVSAGIMSDVSAIYCTVNLMIVLSSFGLFSQLKIMTLTLRGFKNSHNYLRHQRH